MMKRCLQRIGSLCLVVLGVASAAALDQSPFQIQSRLAAANQQAPVLTLVFRAPQGHYLYEHMMDVTAVDPPGVTLSELSATPSVRKYDDLLEQEVGTYTDGATFTYRVSGLRGSPLTVEVNYQGCNETTCFIPQTERLLLRPGGEGARVEAQAQPATEGSEDWQALAKQFTLQGRETGFMDPDAFLTFLEQSREGNLEDSNLLQRVVKRYGLLVAMLLIIPLGLLLNLTPCVLPMIPINLAIIGAGAQAGSKKRGFLLGSVYGLAMALVYGILGLIVVTTGSRFGALNSSPWFNLAIAVVFVALGLAMFDVFVIDFSRFQKGGAGHDDTQRKAPFVTTFIVGAMAALLAGACVAPVLIWVLVLSIDLYASGRALVGLTLPFLLGVGMALPWPFAGAGLSFLPKPGAWMTKVKYAFGIIIFLAAAYYGHQGYLLLRNRTTPIGDLTAETHREQVAIDEDGWITSLQEGLQTALAENKPVFLDFWALSCKSCMKMKRTTFKDTLVKQALEEYVTIAFQADDAGEAHVRSVLQHYDVLGLPTYLVLHPKNQDK